MMQMVNDSNLVQSTHISVFIDCHFKEYEIQHSPR